MASGQHACDVGESWSTATTWVPEDQNRKRYGYIRHCRSFYRSGVRMRISVAHVLPEIESSLVHVWHVVYYNNYINVLESASQAP